jgi:hypothetical protein
MPDACSDRDGLNAADVVSQGPSRSGRKRDVRCFRCFPKTERLHAGAIRADERRVPVSRRSPGDSRSYGRNVSTSSRRVDNVTMSPRTSVLAAFWVF